ncbi:MAG: phosphate ABC transporter permease PstA [Armatimonadetes bacterium]|nr:phosphate ABC transporter permease PstA [Armatimonadota bacterium]MDI9583901.1 phosphate ABC transporter permease PstA [Acidobacteriota bacterium]
MNQSLAFGCLGLLALSIVAPAILIVWFVLAKGGSMLSVEFLTAMPKDGMTAGGIFPAIAGSIGLVLATMVFAVPVGVLGAVYLSEYARQGLLVRAIRIAIMNLAGVPSIVYGLFGMGVFVMVVMPAIINALNLDPHEYSRSCLLAGAATLALLVLPMIITTSEEALRQVPQHQRHASLALGATKWQTIWRIVLPNAMPGILTGLVLAIGRAAGETAPILLTGAVFYMSRMPGAHDALFKPFMALPYHLFAIATQLPTAPDELKWGVALVLLSIVLGFNIIAVAMRTYLRRKRV